MQVWSVRCTKLVKTDWLSKADPVVACFLLNDDGSLAQSLGQTEFIKNDHNPTFDTPLRLDAAASAGGRLRFVVVDADNEDPVDPSGDYMGKVETSLGEIMNSAAISGSEAAFQLTHDHPIMQKKLTRAKSTLFLSRVQGMLPAEDGAGQQSGSVPAQEDEEEEEEEEGSQGCQARLDAALAREQELRSRADAMRAELAAAQQYLSDARSKLEQPCDACAEARAQLEKAQQELGQTRQELDETQRALGEAQAEIAAMRSTARRASTETIHTQQALELRNKELENRIVVLQSQMEEAGQAASGANVAVSDLEARLADAEQRALDAERKALAAEKRALLSDQRAADADREAEAADLRAEQAERKAKEAMAAGGSELGGEANSRERALQDELRATKQGMQVEIDRLSQLLRDAQDALESAEGGSGQRANMTAQATKYLLELKPWIGIVIDKPEFEAADQRGVMVTQVVAGGLAHRFGIKVNDVLEQANGVPTPFNANFAKQIRAVRPGDRLSLQVNTSGVLRNVQIEVGAKALPYEFVVELRRMEKGIVVDTDAKLLHELAQGKHWVQRSHTVGRRRVRR